MNMYVAMVGWKVCLSAGALIKAYEYGLVTKKDVADDNWNLSVAV